MPQLRRAGERDAACHVSACVPHGAQPVSATALQLSVACADTGTSDPFAAFTYAAKDTGGASGQLSGLEKGLIIGLAVAGLVVVALLGLLWRSSNRRRSEEVGSERQMTLLAADSEARSLSYAN